MKKFIYMIFILIFTYSIYMCVNVFLNNNKNKELYSNLQKNYIKQSESSKELKIKPEEKKILVKFNELLSVNKDIVGWININNTNINYPVVKTNDNLYYLNHGINHKKSISGSIFMDYRNNIIDLDKNTIIYGHNMKNGTMFKDLVKYKQKDFFYNNKFIFFDTLYDENKFEIFSVYVTDTKFNYIQTYFNTSQEYKNFLNTIKEKSIYKTDIYLTENDNILTLSTCSYEFENARFVVHAKLR